VSVIVQLPNGKPVAKIAGINDGFHINTKSRHYKLNLIKSINENQIPGSIAIVKTTKRQGSDVWKFDFTIEFQFSEGSPMTKTFPAITLEANKEKELHL